MNFCIDNYLMQLFVFALEDHVVNYWPRSESNYMLSDLIKSLRPHQVLLAYDRN